MCEGESSSGSLGYRDGHIQVPSHPSFSHSPGQSPAATGRYKGAEPCSVNLACAGDTVSNDDTLQGYWTLIVLQYFQRVCHYSRYAQHE